MAHVYATTPAGGDASPQEFDPELAESRDEEPTGSNAAVASKTAPTAADPAVDAAVVAAVRQGEVDRYRELVVRYQGKLIATLQQFVGARHQAEELAHQTFVDAYRSLKRYDAKRPFSAWLHRIAINNAKDWLKSHKRGEATLPESVASGVGVFAASLPDPERAASATQQLQRLQDALHQLPAELREAVILHSVQGLSYREMNDITGVTVTALKNRVVRGRAKLRELLGNDDD